MKRVRLALILYVLAGLAPLGVLGWYAGVTLEREESAAVREANREAEAAIARIRERYAARMRELVAHETSREFIEYQHWYYPSTSKASAPSVVRSPLAPSPADPLVRMYFQVVSSEERALAFMTPHEMVPVDNSNDIKHDALRQPAWFDEILKERRKTIMLELRQMLLAAPFTTSAQGQSVPQQQRDYATVQANPASFLMFRSGEQPSARYSVLNEFLVVNCNAQVVAERAYEQQQNRTGKSKKENTRDYGWSDLVKPKDLGDPTGESEVQVYPFCAYYRAGATPMLLLWRTVRTPAQYIMQGFELNLDYARGAYLDDQLRGQASLARGEAESGKNIPAALNVASADFGERIAPLFESRPLAPRVDVAAIGREFDLTRRNYGMVALGYVALLLMLGFFIHRAVSRSDALVRQQGEFVAAVSHELRTPLTAMRLFTELLIGQARAGRNEKVEQHASRILAEEERLTRLVEMILLSARIERGSFKVEMVTAPLADPLNAALEMSRRAHSERQLIADLPDLPAVRLDRTASQQVFFNLIDNALKYSREGGKPVYVRAEVGKERVVVRVSDEGVGISDADKARLFERFYRGQKASEYGAGTGLGLWLCREYARQMGWEIRLESELGKGTTAVIEVPLNAPS
jgi:signal transduction histidine kinase